MGEVDTKQRILTEASELIREEGLEGLSMRKLAGRLRLSATALYRHFEDKEQLLVAVCTEGFDRFSRYLFQALEEDTAWRKLGRSGSEYRRFALDYPNFYRVMFMSPPHLLGAVKIPERNQRRIDATFQFLVDRVSACVHAGDLQPRDPLSMSASIWAHCHGLVALRLDARLSRLSEDEFETFFEDSLKFHLLGLQQRPGSHPSRGES